MMMLMGDNADMSSMLPLLLVQGFGGGANDSMLPLLFMMNNEDESVIE